jgi:hypothetical protein
LTSGSTKLASSGIIDPATARKLGEVAGVDCLVSGSLTLLGDSVLEFRRDACDSSAAP